MSASERTEVLTGQKEIMERIVSIFSRAKRGVDILAEALAPPDPSQAEYTKKAADAYFDVQKRGGRLRMLTKIDGGNAAYLKELVKNIEARGNFVVTDSEYVSSQGSSMLPPNAVLPAIYSNSESLVEQNAYVFETLWREAESADERFKEIEKGFDQAKTEIIHDPGKIRRLYLDLVKQAKEEILLILPTVNAFHRQQRIGVIEAAQAASERGVKVSIMSPDSFVHDTLQELSGRIEAKVGRRLMNHRSIPQAEGPIGVTVIVVDRNASLVIEQEDDSQQDFEKANDVATLSTRNSTVLANVRFFERLWQEVDLILGAEDATSRERRSRKTAELLQDILSHDIRNYNQISMTSAELLRVRLQENAELLKKATMLVSDVLKDDRSKEGSATKKKLRGYLGQIAKFPGDADKLIVTMIRAINGSTDLIERAKKLGSIVSQEEVHLHPVDLEGSIRKSMDLVVDAHPLRSISPSFSVMPGARVLADEMLEEVFTNILSNSVNYTERDEVPVEIKVEAVSLEERPGTFWKTTFTDHGKGIPDEFKEKVFERYHKTASGKGLGLSIVYALAVERYSGKLKITDRVAGDLTKGTKIELWLPKAT